MTLTEQTGQPSSSILPALSPVQNMAEKEGRHTQLICRVTLFKRVHAHVLWDISPLAAWSGHLRRAAPCQIACAAALRSVRLWRRDSEQKALSGICHNLQQVLNRVDLLGLLNELQQVAVPALPQGRFCLLHTTPHPCVHPWRLACANALRQNYWLRKPALPHCIDKGMSATISRQSFCIVHDSVPALLLQGHSQAPENLQNTGVARMDLAGFDAYPVAEHTTA